MIFVISLPVFSIFFKLFVDSINDLEENSNEIAWIIVSAVFILLLIVGLVLYLKLHIPLRTNDKFSRLDNFFFASTITHKLLVSLIIIQRIAAEDIASYSTGWILTILNLMGALSTCLGITLKNSFFDYQTINYLVPLQASILAASTSNLIGLIKVHFFKLVPTSIIIQTTILFVFCFKIIKNRVYAYQTQEFRDFNSTNISKTWSYVIMMNMVKKEEALSQRIVYQDNIKSHFEKLKFSKNFNPKDFLTATSRKNSDTSKLISAFILLEEFGDFYNSYLLSQSLLKNSFSTFSTKFGALYIQILIEEKFHELNSSHKVSQTMEDFFKFRRCFEFLQNKLAEYVEQNISFFKLLREKVPDLYEISISSVQLQNKFEEISEYWKRSIQNSYEKVPHRMLHAFSLFYSGIKIKPQESRQLTTQVNMRLFDRSTSDKQGFDLWINDDNTIYVVSSIHSNSIGKILTISNSATTVLGFKEAGELIGKGLNVIQPQYLTDLYNELVISQALSDQNFNKIIDLNSFIAHKNEFLIPCKIQSKIWLSPDHGLCLGSIITPQASLSNVILLDRQEKIVGLTYGLKEIVEIGSSFDAENANRLISRWTKKAVGLGQTHKSDESDSPLFKISDPSETYKITPIITSFGPYEIKTLHLEVVDANTLTKKFSSEVKEESVDLLEISDEVDPEHATQYSDNEENKTVKIPQKVKTIQVLDKAFNTQVDYLNSHKSSNMTEKDAKYEVKAYVKNQLDGADGQSVITGKSDYSIRRLDVLFNFLQKKLKFYKFRHSHFLFLTYMVFLLLFAISILVSYIDGMAAVDQTKERIKLILGFSDRNRAILNVGRFVWIDYLFYSLLQGVFPPDTYNGIVLGNQISSIAAVPLLTETNSKTKQILNSLKDNELKTKLFEENIRVFYGDYDQIMTTDKYYLADTFKACDQLIASLDTYLPKMLDRTPANLELLNQIFANMFNDIQSKSKDTEDILQKSIRDILESISNITLTIYIICFVSLGIFFFAVIYVMVVYFVDTAEFFILFANHYIEDLNNRIKNLEGLKAILSHDLHKDTDLSSLDEFVIINNSKISMKNIKTTKLFFFIFVKRLTIYLGLLVPSLVVLGLSYKYSFEYNDVVVHQVENIIKINRITYDSYLMYNQIELNDIYFGKFITKGDYFTDIIDSEIENLRNSVSSLQNFDPTLDQMLSANVCNYYNKTASAFECSSLLNGLGEQGIRAYVYHFADLLTSERDYLKNLTYSPMLSISLLLRGYRADLYYLLIDGIIPATTKFIDEISTSLLNYLDDQLSGIIGQFIGSIVIDIICVVSIIILVYGNLIEERKKFVNTINFVPLDFILINNNFKMYMIKEDKEFVKLFKHAELLKKKFVSNKKV